MTVTWTTITKANTGCRLHSKKKVFSHWLSSGADGRAYSHVTTKIFRMHEKPNLLTHGAPLGALRARESFAIK